MTAYNLSVTTSASSPVYTQDMSTLDTVTVTVNVTGSFTDPRISAVVVSGPVTISLAEGEIITPGQSFTITPSATGTYSVKITAKEKFTDQEYAFVNGTISVPINPPDTTVTVAANTNIAWDATSVVIPLSNATNGDYYKITANGSTTALGFAIASGTTANVNVTSGLPALGTSSLYQIYALRTAANGGDNTYYICNGGATFTITRPTVSTSTTAVASDVTITATATAASTNLTSLTANQQYRILDGTYLRSIVITSNGSNTSLAITYTVTAPTYPTPGTSKTYTLQTRLESSYGGDNIWVTADTFTLTREDYDVTPDSPNLGANITGAGLGMYYYSSYWTVTGIDTGITASVTSGHMSVNNGSWVTSATVYNGDIVRVRLLSSTSLSTSVSTTITAGGLSDAWTVTTRAGITVPLVPLVDQPINTLVETAPVTIAGLASGESRTISVFEFHYPGTQISINGGAWGNGGPVSNGDTVKGRHTTAATYGTTVETFLLMPPDTVAPVKSTTRVADVTPDPVNVGLDVAGRELGEFTPSATTFNITGMDNYTPENPVTAYARFSGDIPAYMSINNAAYTTAANVKNGDQLRVAMYASNSYSTTKTVNFLLGPTPHSDSWSVTTRAVDVNPATPNLGNDLTGREVGELTYSGSSTVLNIDPIDGGVPVTIPVSISGNSATFQVNGTGGWVTSANVSLNDTIQARMYSSPNYSTTVSTVLTLGTFSEDTDTWSVTTRAADEEPNTPQLGDNPPVTDPGTTKYSAIWTITGMDPAPATALATTTNGGTFQVNGTGDWVNSASVSGGNTIQVRLTASVAYSTSVSTILTVGGQSSAPFIVTTRDADVTPNDFTFIDENNVPLNTFKLSNIITVASVEIPVPVTVSGGSYTKNGGAYTTVTGSAQNGDYFQVAHTSSGSYSTATNTTLTIGGVSDTYTTTTLAEILPDDEVGFTPVSGSYTIDSTDTSVTVVVTGCIAEEFYVVRLNNGTVNLTSGTGSTTLSLTFSSNLPILGETETYEIFSMRPLALGGTGIYYPTDDIFTVTRSDDSPPPNEDPVLDTYGIAIYDHNENLVSSFATGHSLLRTVFTGTAVLSSSGTTSVPTGLTGLSYSNSIIEVDYASSAASTQLPSKFSDDGTSVIIGRHDTAPTVTVTVIQYAGTSKIPGTSADYALEIRNGDNSVVLDEGALTYGVKEIINGGSSAVSSYLQISSNARVCTVTLTQGTYPASNGTPVVAINSTLQSILIPPILGATKWPDNSYKYVYFFISSGATISNYNIAMLVPSNITSPSYYSSNNEYGLEIKDTLGNLIWSSNWRQAIVNNIVPINIFTTGLNQEGPYDVSSGYDGVIPPDPPLRTEFIEDLLPTASSKGVSNLNSMDPPNTYLIGDSSSGRVGYYTGKLWYDDYNYTLEGGGVFIPAANVTSPTSVSVRMWQLYEPGFDAPSGVADSSRDPESKHPEGNFIFLRIT